MIKVSVIIFTYNQAGYIRQALEGACAQTIKPAEIIVVDDASTDSTFEVAKQWIQRHAETSVSIVRNEANLGVVGSVSRWCSKASGDIVIPMAGDDISLPDRVAEVVAHFVANPESYALVASGMTIDNNGQLVGSYGNGIDRRISLTSAKLECGDFLDGLGATGASSAYRRDLFTRFAKMRENAFAEDRILCFRALLLGTCDFSSSKHVLWRRHSANLSIGGHVRSGISLAAHFDRCESMIQQHLDDLEQMGGHLPQCHHALKAELSYAQARWRLWSAANKEGVKLASFCVELQKMYDNSSSLFLLLRDVARTAFHMLTPFLMRKLFVGIFRQ